MKVFAFVCLLLALSACKKFDGENIPLSRDKAPVWAARADTIPDNATLKVKLFKDRSDYDETAFIFDRKASVFYDPKEDAKYLNGFGDLSLSSITSDGSKMAVYTLPYKAGMSVALSLRSSKDGRLNLEISREKNIPQDIRIWVKDNYANDSLDLCKGTYSFTVTRADTNTFGSRRLKLVLKSTHSY